MSGEEIVSEPMVSDEVKVEIPFSLREFGEVPADYVSVYMVVSREQAEEISKEGIVPIDPGEGVIKTSFVKMVGVID